MIINRNYTRTHWFQIVNSGEYKQLQAASQWQGTWSHISIWETIFCHEGNL